MSIHTLRSQTLFVLVGVLAVSHLIGITIYSADRHTTLAADHLLDVAERAVGTVQLLDKLPAEWRESVVAATNSRTLRVSMSSTPSIESSASDDEELEEVWRYFAEHLGRTDGARIRIREAAQHPEVQNMPSAAKLLQVSVAFNGDWLNATGVVAPSESLWPRPVTLYILSVLIGLIAAGMWMVNRVTSPLTTFAQAADRLGKDLRSEPLPTSGPEEVAKAAKAFNGMQQRLQRMIENRTEMLAAISHDLRTPITLLSLRAEKMADSADRDKLLATLEEMQSMIASVLDFSRATFQEEPPRLVDLAALLESVCEDMRATGAEIHLASLEPVRYHCRRGALKRALSNLLDNAVRYAGSAQIKLYRDDSRNEIVVEIADEGSGFHDDEIEDLFVPFFRAERSRSRDTGGAGLGLSITKAIVESHGGTVDIRNRTPKGAIATIRLPD